MTICALDCATITSTPEDARSTAYQLRVSGLYYMEYIAYISPSRMG